MMTRSFRRTTILLLLVAVLATPCVWAAGPAQAPEPAGHDFLRQLWNSLWSLWSKEGCGIDPDGRCIPGAASPLSTTPHTETGCGIDPNGRCSPPPTIQTDEGCGIDPNGRCHS